ERLQNVAFRLVRAGGVVGRVTSAHEGQPIAGIVVAAYNLDGTRRGFQRTGANGTYEIVLPPGTYKVAAFDSTALFAPLFYSGAKSADTALTLTVSAPARVSGIDFPLVPAGTISGSVADKGTGIPLPAITVGSYDPSGAPTGAVSTDMSGHYMLSLGA